MEFWRNAFHDRLAIYGGLAGGVLYLVISIPLIERYAGPVWRQVWYWPFH